MQKDPLVSALVGALLLGSIATLALGYGYSNLSSKGRALQVQITNIQTTGAVAEALANDALAYSRTHPAINPILLRAGIPAGQPAPK